MSIHGQCQFAKHYDTMKEHHVDIGLQLDEISCCTSYLMKSCQRYQILFSAQVCGNQPLPAHKPNPQSSATPCKLQGNMTELHEPLLLNIRDLACCCDGIKDYRQGTFVSAPYDTMTPPSSQLLAEHATDRQATPRKSLGAQSSNVAYSQPSSNKSAPSLSGVATSQP